MAKLIEVSVISLLLLCLAVAEGAKINETCTAKDNCTVTATYSDCTGAINKTTCTCNTGFQTKADLTKCFKLINDTCAKDDECPDNAECDSTKCHCKMSFVASTDKIQCNVATALTTSVILLMAAMLVSRFFSALGLENVI